MGLVNFKFNLPEHRFLSCFLAHSLQAAACASSPVKSTTCAEAP